MTDNGTQPPVAPEPPPQTFKVEFDEDHDIMTIQIPIKRVVLDGTDQMFIFMRGYLEQARDLAMAAIAEKRAKEQAAKLILRPGPVQLKVQ